MVGINTWVAHINRSVFGPDAEVFRPERWLEDPKNADRMEQYLLTVSALTVYIAHLPQCVDPEVYGPLTCFIELNSSAVDRDLAWASTYRSWNCTS